MIYFRNFVLHWYEEALVWVVNETPEKIMDRCAAEPDKKYITTESYNSSAENCLKHCKDWRLAVSMCDRMEKKSNWEFKKHTAHFKKWLKEYEKAHVSDK